MTLNLISILPEINIFIVKIIFYDLLVGLRDCFILWVRSLLAPPPKTTPLISSKQQCGISWFRCGPHLFVWLFPYSLARAFSWPEGHVFFLFPRAVVCFQLAHMFIARRSELTTFLCCVFHRLLFVSFDEGVLESLAVIYARKKWPGLNNFFDKNTRAKAYFSCTFFWKLCSFNVSKQLYLQNRISFEISSFELPAC